MGLGARAVRSARVLGHAARLVAALVALAVSSAACSGGSPSAPRSSPVAASTAASTLAPTPAPTPAPAVTLDEARRVLADLLAADDVARANGDERLALDLSRDAVHATTAAVYRSAGMAPPRYVWRSPTLLVPRLTTYPYWFAATAERRYGHDHGHAQESRKAVLVLMRESERDRWRIAFSSLLDKGQSMPDVELDAEGYATALDTRDESVTISPHLMGPLHATIAEEGTGGFAAGLIAGGPHTTGYFSQIKKTERVAKDRDCMNYDSIFAATTFPVFALRTPAGGAVVMYSLLRTTSWTPVLKCGEGRRLPIPEGAEWLLDDTVVLKQRRIIETQQYVATVPAKNATTTAKVIGYTGWTTKATAR